ncbi:MAG: hypothetical protein BWY12_02208 [candidate division BRC1 bacterium ADurb.Bin183]|nr:MAG: hypothetical protein BWY12_02208 [candidate division BRC1 bacterium ADurb.Bin183]
MIHLPHSQNNRPRIDEVWNSVKVNLFGVGEIFKNAVIGHNAALHAPPAEINIVKPAVSLIQIDGLARQRAGDVARIGQRDGAHQFIDGGSWSGFRTVLAFILNNRIAQFGHNQIVERKRLARNRIQGEHLQIANAHAFEGFGKLLANLGKGIIAIIPRTQVFAGELYRHLCRFCVRDLHIHQLGVCGDSGRITRIQRVVGRSC